MPKSNQQTPLLSYSQRLTYTKWHLTPPVDPCQPVKLTEKREAPSTLLTEREGELEITFPLRLGSLSRARRYYLTFSELQTPECSHAAVIGGQTCACRDEIFISDIPQRAPHAQIDSCKCCSSAAKINILRGDESVSPLCRCHLTLG